MCFLFSNTVDDLTHLNSYFEILFVDFATIIYVYVKEKKKEDIRDIRNEKRDGKVALRAKFF